MAGTEDGSSPFFSPDGTWIGFFADGRLRRVPAGGGAVADIAAAPGFPAGASWGPDDREFLGDDAVEASTWVFADGESRRVVRGGWGGTLSRDGRWLAYHSNESGRYEVYAIPLPEGGARWQISDDGGRHATWSPDGTEVSTVTANNSSPPALTRRPAFAWCHVASPSSRSRRRYSMTTTSILTAALSSWSAPRARRKATR